ncbi:hypothetical protein CFOL_v3_12946, partial [Cephalotus follicularis]
RYPQAYFESKILVGKTLNFDFCIVEGFPIVGWLNALDLGPLFMINLPHHPDLMKEFYANFLNNSIGTLYRRVKNIHINIDSSTIAFILSIPNDGTRGWSHMGWIVGEGFNREDCVHLLFGKNAQVVEKMTRSAHIWLDYRFLHRAVATHILPKVGEYDEVTHMEAFTIFHIITGRRISIPMHILRHIKAMQARKNARLPYGNIITKILMHFHVDLHGEVHHALQNTDKLGNETLGRIGFKKHRRLRTWIPKED